MFNLSQCWARVLFFFCMHLKFNKFLDDLNNIQTFTGPWNTECSLQGIVNVVPVSRAADCIQSVCIEWDITAHAVFWSLYTGIYFTFQKVSPISASFYGDRDILSERCQSDC
jgi:hypothetical protein